MLKIIKKNTNSLPQCTKYGYVSSHKFADFGDRCSDCTFKYKKRLEKRIENESR